MVIIQESKFIKSSSSIKECPTTELPEVAFVGRSNVGKSSLLNLITGRKSLAKVSGKPGKTRLINHFLIDEKWYLVDLPGYGWASVSKKEVAKWEKMVHDYFHLRENLSIVFVLVDVRHDPMNSDIEMINWLGANGIPVGVIFTKADKISKNKCAQSMAVFKKTMKKHWEELPPFFLTSATKGTGQEELQNYIIKNCIG